MENKGETMPRTRKHHPPALKAKVALEAIKAQRTTSEIAQIYGVHPNLVAAWKKLALELLPEIFTPQTAQARPAADREKEELYRQIGQMKSRWTFSKKLSASSIEDRRSWINPLHPRLTIQRQCKLLHLPRSSYYHAPAPESAEDLHLMRRIDELYLAHPFYMAAAVWPPSSDSIANTRNA